MDRPTAVSPVLADLHFFSLDVQPERWHNACWSTPECRSAARPEHAVPVPAPAPAAVPAAD